MYYIQKTLDVSASHHLTLTYDSKCTRVHGHNWKITVFCKARELDENGMVADFAHIKELIQDKLDHRELNEVLSFHPPAENIARWIVDLIPPCYKASVQETEGNIAIYEED